ncbi:MAG: RidA family protein [Dehalococcoidia bacterium]|jgi:enamine deaminase RidA (YjgF/YER057c/UK114 family)|nr:RidA family protein [Dehalococcoidia bacterium]
MSRNIVEVDPKKFPWLDIARYTFCMAAENAGVFYLSGQTAGVYDPDQGKVVCKGDLLEQTKVIFEKLGVVLEAAGLGFENVVQTVDYVYSVGLPQYRQTGEIRRQYLGSSPVASTGICVERMLRPDALIEISAVAMKAPKRSIDPAPGSSQLTFVPAVEADDTVWLSGITGREVVDGKRHYPRSTARQAELSYQSIGTVLEAAGAQPGDIVKSLDYIAPQATLQYRDTGPVRKDFYGGSYPAATGILINRLLRPEAHVEVEVLAVKDGTRQEITVSDWEGHFGRLTYLPGVKKGRMVHISGETAVDHATGQSVGGFDLAAQADQAYGNIARVLAEAGYSMDDVVNTIEWVAPNGLMGYRGVQEVRRKYFGDSFPSATGVLVHQLLRPELLIEVTAVAMV